MQLAKISIANVHSIETEIDRQIAYESKLLVNQKTSNLIANNYHGYFEPNVVIEEQEINLENENENQVKN